MPRHEPHRVGVSSESRARRRRSGARRVSRAAIEVAAAASKKLPRGVAIDADGKATRDAAAALDGGAQLPAGGIKGALLALLVEVLSGGLAGGDLAVDSDNYHTMDRSLFLLVVDPAMTTREFDVERLPRGLRRAGAAARESREACRADGHTRHRCGRRLCGSSCGACACLGGSDLEGPAA